MMETTPEKEMIFALMMADFDEHGLMQITRETRDSIVDSISELAKAKRKIKALETDRNILTMDINWHNCNTCGRACQFRPLPGERVRSNCYAWLKKDVTKSD